MFVRVLSVQTTHPCLCQLFPFTTRDCEPDLIQRVAVADANGQATLLLSAHKPGAMAVVAAVMAPGTTQVPAQCCVYEAALLHGCAQICAI